MKKISLAILSVVLSFVLISSLTACNAKNENTDSSSDQSQNVSQTVSDTASASNSTSQKTMLTPVDMQYKNIIGKGEIDEEFPVATTKTTIWLVGDSTVCNYSENSEKSTYYFMRNGYGMRISEYLNSDLVTIKNIASSGKSSKDYLTAKKADYDNMVANIAPGDFLIIGFGHNDEKKETARYTDPTGSVTDPTSFKYSLYENYCKIALEKGATPILCTPIVRRSANGTYSSSQLHITTSTTGYNGGDYRQAIVELGEEKNITVVDLTTLTHEYLKGMTSDESATLFAYYQSGSTDNTHLNAYGAQVVARLFIESINLTTNNPLRGYINETLSSPSISVLVPLEA